ncbi:hypothetical protein ACJX0J_028907, partial [Zea mays]
MTSPHFCLLPIVYQHTVIDGHIWFLGNHLTKLLFFHFSNLCKDWAITNGHKDINADNDKFFKGDATSLIHILNSNQFMQILWLLTQCHTQDTRNKKRSVLLSFLCIYSVIILFPSGGLPLGIDPT